MYVCIFTILIFCLKVGTNLIRYLEEEEQGNSLMFWGKIKPSLLWDKWHRSKTIFLQASTCLTLFYILNIEYPKPVAAVIALSVLALFCLFVCEFIFIL